MKDSLFTYHLWNYIALIIIILIIGYVIWGLMFGKSNSELENRSYDQLQEEYIEEQRFNQARPG